MSKYKIKPEEKIVISLEEYKQLLIIKGKYEGIIEILKDDNNE